MSFWSTSTAAPWVAFRACPGSAHPTKRHLKSPGGSSSRNHSLNNWNHYKAFLSCKLGCRIHFLSRIKLVNRVVQRSTQRPALPWGNMTLAVFKQVTAEKQPISLHRCACPPPEQSVCADIPVSYLHSLHLQIIPTLSSLNRRIALMT